MKDWIKNLKISDRAKVALENAKKSNWLEQAKERQKKLQLSKAGLLAELKKEYNVRGKYCGRTKTMYISNFTYSALEEAYWQSRVSFSLVFIN